MLVVLKVEPYQQVELWLMGVWVKLKLHCSMILHVDWYHQSNLVTVFFIFSNVHVAELVHV